MEKARVERPLGIAILAVLGILGGILALFGGIISATLPSEVAEIIGISKDLLIGLGILAAIMGIIAVSVGWGFWKGSKWAWPLGIAFYVVGIIQAVASLALGGEPISILISILIGGLIVYYLFRPNVKAWFGKA